VRPANAPSSFYPYEALLETFLHELTHMVHGPHNQAFYRYFDQLKEEMEEIMSKGLTGIEGVKFAYAGKGHVRIKALLLFLKLISLWYVLYVGD
jgi:hypothetical protein